VAQSTTAPATPQSHGREQANEKKNSQQYDDLGIAIQKKVGFFL
jgi:hypothetical protein